jgi:hypothetical protein
VFAISLRIGIQPINDDIKLSGNLAAALKIHSLDFADKNSGLGYGSSADQLHTKNLIGL